MFFNCLNTFIFLLSSFVQQFIWFISPKSPNLFVENSSHFKKKNSKLLHTCNWYNLISVVINWFYVKRKRFRRTDVTAQKRQPNTLKFKIEIRISLLNWPKIEILCIAPIFKYSYIQMVNKNLDEEITFKERRKTKNETNAATNAKKILKLEAIKPFRCL